MRLERLRRFWVALAILPLIGGVALAAGPALFVCRGDLVARPTCCCPDHGRSAAASTEAAPSLSAGCCCDVSQVIAPAVPAVEPRVSPHAVAHLAWAPVAGAALLAPSRSVPAWAAAKIAHAPPPAIAIRLAKQSFLV